MAVKLRLYQKEKKQSFAIVAADASNGKPYIEEIGFYEPGAKPARVYLNHEASLKWLRTGAQPTGTVKTLLRHTGVTLKYALSKKGKSKQEMEQIYQQWKKEKAAHKKKRLQIVDSQGVPVSSQIVRIAQENASKVKKDEFPSIESLAQKLSLSTKSAEQAEKPFLEIKVDTQDKGKAEDLVVRVLTILEKDPNFRKEMIQG